MAFGYARSSSKPGVFSVVPGPGVLNAGAALLTAFGCNEPVLCLTGEVPTQFLGKGRGHLHEMPDQLATLRTFVKWADRAEYPDVAPALVGRAFQEMLSGRRGPASLEMPWDVFTQRAEIGKAQVYDPLPAPSPDPDRIKAAAALIKASKHPMIFVGSGAIHDAHGDAGIVFFALAGDEVAMPGVAFGRGKATLAIHHADIEEFRHLDMLDQRPGLRERLQRPLEGFRHGIVEFVERNRRRHGEPQALDRARPHCFRSE